MMFSLVSTPDQLFTVGVAAVCPAKENSENQNLALFSSLHVKGSKISYD